MRSVDVSDTRAWCPEKDMHRRCAVSSTKVAMMKRIFPQVELVEASGLAPT